MSTIVAVSTPYGTGGIAVIRLSGKDAIKIADKAWQGVGLSDVLSHTAHLGSIINNNGEPLDQAVATVFRGPNSFTGEDTVEFSVHGSKWIQRETVKRLVELGARPAEPGEFTRRAFLNGKMDLAQAEGVADLIAASSRASHKLAMSQMTGSFSRSLDTLRDQLIDLASLLELELDFSEEDVEFADRSKLRDLTDHTLQLIERLASTYDAGRAFKEGVPVAIAGRPNAGKSTLLNALLGEEKAIVSNVPGTTRDIIDDTREIGGVLFRFYDTAGLRDTSDTVEIIGIERARDAIRRASIVAWLVDSSEPSDEIFSEISDIKVQISVQRQSKHIIILNKTDLLGEGRTALDSLIKSIEASEEKNGQNIKIISLSAKEGTDMTGLERILVDIAKAEHDPDSELIITNARHQAALLAGAEHLRRVREGLDSGISADFIAQDVRAAIHELGTLTGAVTTDTLLATIFTRFCIGK